MNFRFPLPGKVRRGEPVKAEWANALVDCLALLGREVNAGKLQNSADIGVRSGPGGLTAWLKRKAPQTSDTKLRFFFHGLVKGEDQWFVHIGVGCVIFNEITENSSFADKEGKAKFCEAVFPTIEVDGDDVRIDDESKPMLSLGNRENGTVWLIVQSQKCQSRSDLERLELTNRGEKPEAEDGEVCVPIADFDVETTGEGENESKKATNVYTYLQSDHQQPYLCEGHDSDSLDDSFGSSFPEDSSELTGSSDSDNPSEDSQSSDDDSGSDDDDEEGCQVKARAWWVGLPTCLTATQPVSKCNPKELVVNVDVKFFRNMNPGFGERNCTKWAYGARLVGATKYPEPASGESDEYVWTDDSERLLTFIIKKPVPCAQYYVEWRVKSFPAPSGPLDEGEPFECCNKSWSGSEAVRDGAYNASAKPLPKICGGHCSSCSGS
jgi:hypothetical protein